MFQIISIFYFLKKKPDCQEFKEKKYLTIRCLVHKWEKHHKRTDTYTEYSIRSEPKICLGDYN